MTGQLPPTTLAEFDSGTSAERERLEGIASQEAVRVLREERLLERVSWAPEVGSLTFGRGSCVLEAVGPLEQEWEAQISRVAPWRGMLALPVEDCPGGARLRFHEGTAAIIAHTPEMLVQLVSQYNLTLSLDVWNEHILDLQQQLARHEARRAEFAKTFAACIQKRDPRP